LDYFRIVGRPPSETDRWPSSLRRRGGKRDCCGTWRRGSTLASGAPLCRMADHACRHHRLRQRCPQAFACRPSPPTRLPRPTHLAKPRQPWVRRAGTPCQVFHRRVGSLGISVPFGIFGAQSRRCPRTGGFSLLHKRKASLVLASAWRPLQLRSKIASPNPTPSPTLSRCLRANGRASSQLCGCGASGGQRTSAQASAREVLPAYEAAPPSPETPRALWRILRRTRIVLNTPWSRQDVLPVHDWLGAQACPLPARPRRIAPRSLRRRCGPSRRSSASSSKSWPRTARTPMAPPRAHCCASARRRVDRRHRPARHNSWTREFRGLRNASNGWRALRAASHVAAAAVGQH